MLVMRDSRPEDLTSEFQILGDEESKCVNPYSILVIDLSHSGNHMR